MRLKGGGCWDSDRDCCKKIRNDEESGPHGVPSSAVASDRGVSLPLAACKPRKISRAHTLREMCAECVKIGCRNLKQTVYAECGAEHERAARHAKCLLNMTDVDKTSRRDAKRGDRYT
jgi:hypothetical protein